LASAVAALMGAAGALALVALTLEDGALTLRASNRRIAPLARAKAGTN
jgi:hypothetical protein